MRPAAVKFSAVAYCRDSLEEFDRIILQVRRCPTIPSLRSVNDALFKLTVTNQSPVHEIADVIRRDQSLTARLLRLVNSVFGGLSVKISSIEEAIFFLGLRQIRQLALTSEMIDEVQKALHADDFIDWKEVWRKSIGCGFLAREILSMTSSSVDDDLYYVCGLLHDIGKLVMLNAFSNEFEKALSFRESSPEGFARREKQEFGWNHAEIGAMYLEINGLPREIVEAVLFHHEPRKAYRCGAFSAGIQVADYISRYGGCPSVFEQVSPISYSDWEHIDGWKMLFRQDAMESRLARASVLKSIERLPSLLKGLL